MTSVAQAFRLRVKLRKSGVSRTRTAAALAEAVRPARRTGERGAALISILLLLIIMSALSAALTISTRTEVMVARNRQSSAQARAAAEAGLNHASEVTIANILQWQANGFANVPAAITRLLRGPDNLTGNAARDADNGSLENLGIPRPPARLGLNNLPNVGYEARVFDEDDAGRGLTLSAADRASISEDGNATNDGNSTILVRSIGYANDGTQLTLEATISPVTLPAILTDGDLTVTGNATVAGLGGSIHSNQDLTVSGSASIADDATSTGTYSQGGGSVVGGTSGGEMPSMPVVPVSAASYRNNPAVPLSFVLESDGRVTHPTTGALLCDGTIANNCNAVLGVRWTYSGPGWNIAGGGGTSAGMTFGTYYVEGPVNITSNPGTAANPVQITIIAEGSIDMSGNPDFTPFHPGLMFVTDGDLRIAGNFDMAPPPPNSREGQILVREQIEITGNSTLFGQITVDDAAQNSNLVTSNRITGSSTITYNALNSTNTFTIGAWREVR